MADFIAGDLNFRLSVDGQAHVVERMQGMMQRVENWQPVLEEVGDVLLDYLSTAFETGGAGTAHGWAPLSPRYSRWKAKHYPGKPILTRTGALRKSLTEKQGAGSLYELTKNFVAVGSDYRAGAYGLGRLHQYGTTRMPRRRVFDLPDHTVAMILQKLRQHVSWETVR